MLNDLEKDALADVKRMLTFSGTSILLYGYTGNVCCSHNYTLDIGMNSIYKLENGIYSKDKLND